MTEQDKSTTPPSARPRVFISYSHDSPEHRQRVLALANQLRKDGVEVWIDQYIQDPNEGWIRWMRSQVKQANRVLLVFTETYQRRFEGDEEEGKGLGATFEGVIVTQALYESGGRTAKFRPLIFQAEDERFIPLELRRFNRYRVDTPDHYQNLLRWLHEAPQIIAPTVGHKPDLPPQLAPALFPRSPNEPQVSAAEVQPHLDASPPKSTIKSKLPRVKKKRLTWSAGVTIALLLLAVGLILTILLVRSEVEIRGVVVDEQKNAIPGVRVNVTGHSEKEVETDRGGSFILKSHVGKNQQVRLHFEKKSFRSVENYYDVGRQPITITLSPALDQPTVDFSVISEIHDNDFTVAYSAERLSEKLRITPTLLYLDLFRRGGPITPRDDLSFHMNLPQLDIKVTNNTNKTVFFNEAVFIVDSSQLDPSPLFVIPGTGYNMGMSFKNLGWKRITNATIRCNLIRPGQPEDFTQPAKEILNVTEDDHGDIYVDFSQILTRLGVDVETLRHLLYEINDETYKVKTQRLLKALGPFPEGKAEVVGEISYANPVDTGKMESVRFVCFVGFEGPLETARMGSSFEYNVKLDITGLDVVGQHYERRIQLSQALKPHDFDRFTIRIAADKSSIHRFRLRLLYDNGFAIDSPPIELDLFMPRGSESFLRKVKGE